MKKIPLIFVSLLCIYTSLSAVNLVKNPGFMEPQGNGPLPGSWVINTPERVSLEIAGGNTALKLSNAAGPQYLEASQSIPLDPGKIKVVTVKAKIKINNVIKGVQDWEMARVMVLFFDKAGAQLGGWPELGRWKGTFDWAEKVNIINVPDTAAEIRLQIQLANCTGEMYISGISVEAGDNLIIPRAENEYVINGSMEFGSNLPFYWGGWVNGEGSFESPGHQSPMCFRISNASKGYSMITQQIPIDPKKTANINVSGYVKVSGVVEGSNSWEKARISVEFHDVTGARIGDWPPVVGEASYNIDEWTMWTKSYKVPAGTSSIVIGAGLLNCSGTVWIDDISMTASDKKGRELKPDGQKPEDTSKWFPFTFEEDTYRPDAVIDFTGDLDKPAGRHGALTVAKDASLVFVDGDTVKFWGTNIVGSDIFRGHAETDKMVKRLAKLGVNMVRLHHMDAWWADPGIFQGVTDTTRSLSPESLEKLDYLVYKLKEAGVYMFMDMLVHRKPKKDDGVADFEKVPAGFKEVIFFDEKLQDLTKEYITELLTHVNQYTKTAYKDENAVVMTEIVNESTLFYFDRNPDIPASYREKLDSLFNKFLKNKYKDMGSLKQAWDKYRDNDLAASEDFEKGSIKRAQFSYDGSNWSSSGASSSAGRASDTKEFYYVTESAFFKKFHDHIRSLDKNILITGSNHWENWDADLKADASLDFIDRHTYWDHPSGGWTMQENLSFTDAPMIRSKQNCVVELAQNHVLGKPFTVTEYNSPLPNEFRAGFPLIMAAYARFNDFDAMLQFNFTNYAWQDTLSHFTDFSVCPDMLSSWTPAVYLFSRGYVKTGNEKLVEYVSDNDIFSNKNSSFKLINNDYSSPMLIRSYKTFDPLLSYRKFNPALKKDAALSMSQELYWNLKKGIFEINADRIQGVAGFLRSDKDGYKFKNFRVRSTNLYASVFISSIDGAPLSGSSKILLNTVARMDNYGARYSPSHTSVIYGGSSPIMLEPVYSELRITLNRFKSLKIFTLDANNYIKNEYKNFTTPDKNTLMIKTDEDSKALNYYIEVTR